MVSFRDPIHGDLAFDGVIEELILSPEFQRLSEVKQLGLTDKVYPGANHTRFSHALGACYLAGEITRRLKVPEADRLLIQIAALLHDIGHYDFSHALEHEAPYDHEENGKRIIMGTASLPGREARIHAILVAHGIDPEKIVSLLHKAYHQENGTAFPDHYASILSCPVIDVDRMDFLKRDTYYSGAVIGEIDIGRLLGVFCVTPEGKLGITYKGVASLEQFVVARMHMYQQVYMHPDSNAGETMLRKAVAASKDIAMPLLYGDGELLARLAMHGSPITRELVMRIRNGKRSFYPTALVVETTSATPAEIERALALGKDPAGTEARLLAMTGAKDGEILLGFPSTRKNERTLPSFPVRMEDGTWREFYDLAPIARAAATQAMSQKVMVVYAAPALAEKAREAAQELLRTD
jgi:hypothetical protein